MEPLIRGVGVNLPFTGWTLAQSLDLARQCQDWGYDAVWTSERNGWDSLAFAGALTQAVDVPVGIAVVSVFSRPPALVAMGAAGLSDLSGGRFVLGLGVSSPLITTKWMGAPFERPLQRMREYLTVVRAVLAGEKVDHHGGSVTVEGFRLGAAPAATPLYAAALGPKMTALAGELADGVILHMTPEERIDDVMRPARAAAAEAGRPAPRSMMTMPVIVGDDTRGARRSLATLGLAYAQAPAYAAHLARIGLGEETARCLDLWRAGDRAGAVDGMDPRLVSVFGIHGTAHECRRRIAAYLDAGLHQLNVHVLPTSDDPGQVRTWLKDLAPTADRD